MNKIFIFSGTTEGRLLSEYLCQKGIENTVFVATDYGQVVMHDHPLCTVVQGRMSYENMVALFKKEAPDIVVDATHPFAVEVSCNIKNACQASGTMDAYIRLARHIEDLAEGGLITRVLSTEEAIAYLEKTSGNILLTTGVKTLSKYTNCPKLKDRLFARILPSMESFLQAMDTGLSRRQIIAMEGPFIKAMNEALIDQYNIDILVTKNSGTLGGIEEKISACQAKGIQAVIIDLEDSYKNDGYSLKQVKEMIAERLTECSAASFNEIKSRLNGLLDKVEQANQSKSICIVGIGMGNDASITVAGKQCIQNAQLIIGARRMLEYGSKINPQARQVAEYMPEDIVTAIKAASEENIAVLMSGDTGFYSGSQGLIALLEAGGISYKLYSGISSISYFSSIIGKGYSQYPLLSAHGKKLVIDKSIMAQGGFFAILSGCQDIKYIIDQLQEYRGAAVYVGYNLGQADQQVDCFKLGDPYNYDSKGLYVMGVFLNEDYK